MNERARPEAVVEPVLEVSVENGIARLTMNRPKQYNAISREMLDAMQSALDGIARDRAVRAVVIAGHGPAFSGGHDLKEMMACRTEEFIGGLFDACSRVMKKALIRPTAMPPARAINISAGSERGRSPLVRM